MTMLYAWAKSAFFSESPVDHTWVTTYDSRTDQKTLASIISSGLDYWYCWGDFHGTGNLLGKQDGSLNLARCLVQSNTSSTSNFNARGTIFSYGTDGVCHQLANQVLYATGMQNLTPLTVFRARGYKKSFFIYGTYGLQRQKWEEKKQQCTSLHLPISGVHSMSQLHDNFEQYARRLITDPQKLNSLLQLRESHQFTLSDIENRGAVTAVEINAKNQELLDEAARLLGRELFERVFDTLPDKRTNLVDPEILQQMNRNQRLNIG